MWEIGLFQIVIAVGHLLLSLQSGIRFYSEHAGRYYLISDILVEIFPFCGQKPDPVCLNDIMISEIIDITCSFGLYFKRIEYVMYPVVSGAKDQTRKTAQFPGSFLYRDLGGEPCGPFSSPEFACGQYALIADHGGYGVCDCPLRSLPFLLIQPVCKVKSVVGNDLRLFFIFIEIILGKGILSCPVSKIIPVKTVIAVDMMFQ